MIETREGRLGWGGEEGPAGEGAKRVLGGWGKVVEGVIREGGGKVLGEGEEGEEGEEGGFVVKVGERVEGVEIGEGEVVVRSEGKGVVRERRGRMVVTAIPPRVVSMISFSPFPWEEGGVGGEGGGRERVPTWMEGAGKVCLFFKKGFCFLLFLFISSSLLTFVLLSLFLLISFRNKQNQMDLFGKKRK